MTEQAAPVITSSKPGSFAHGVLAKRHPALIQQVSDALPYSPQQRRALDDLREEGANRVLTPLDTSAFDYAAWEEWGSSYFGRSWFDVPFLWSESYFYRRLLDAVGYFDPGPWQRIDPFAPFKRAELRGAAVKEELAALDVLPDLPEQQQAEMLLQSSLWGNRADLGFRIAAEQTALGDVDTGLVADDSALLWERLTTGTPGTVAVVADNAGRELIPDLVLIDHLLTNSYAADVVLHVKPYPYYVSDAMLSDVLDCLHRLLQASGQAQQIGRRLWNCLGKGRLCVSTHPFFCAPLPFTAMPDDLCQQFAATSLTIFKGNLNYRRLVGDQLWAATTPYAQLSAYFPGPVATLRTLKSDVIIGLTPQKLAALDETQQEWRTAGTHALVQAR
ncbi:damage-control phosphatase ARMT1 family protein [Streptacidiphilus sp. EB103A]|uniref:damage-control phosphatase ARMT1 family protein n=1 Tax=Streptacidiphilus sp. EB103A TaxID=3156275 RepID=UPI0035120A85